MLEGTFKGHLVQPPAVSSNIYHWIKLLRAPSNMALNVSRDGASTTSMGNPFQCFTTLTVKTVFLISSLNPPSFHLKLLPLVLLQQALLKSLSPSYNPPSGTGKLLNNPNSQPFLIGEVLHPSDHFCVLLWTRSNRPMTFPC